MKSINIALIAILVLVAPIFAAEDAYATVCHGKNMTDNKFGEFVRNEVLFIIFIIFLIKLLISSKSVMVILQIF